jgi:hypothetical protein
MRSEPRLPLVERALRRKDPVLRAAVARPAANSTKHSLIMQQSRWCPASGSVALVKRKGRALWGARLRDVPSCNFQLNDTTMQTRRFCGGAARTILE